MTSSVLFDSWSSVVTVLKEKWFQIEVISEGEKNENEALLSELFLFYSKPRKIFKFMTKIFSTVDECVAVSSVNNLLSQGYVYTGVLKSFTKSVELLSSRQNLELWENFNSSFKKYHNVATSDSCGGAAFLIAQFFSTFLLHATFFDDAPSLDKVDVLLKNTYNILEEKSIILKENNSELLKSSFLVVCCACGNINIAFQNCRNEHGNVDLQDEESVFDFSVLYPFFSCEYMKIFKSMMKRGNKRLSYLVVKLLIQKLRYLLISNGSEDHMKMLTSLVFAEALKNRDFGSAWNLNVCSLNDDNYPVALWYLLLENMPVLLNFASYNDVSSLCKQIIHIVLNESRKEDFFGTDMKSVVVKFISSNFFTESRIFQTAFVTAFWSYSVTLLHAKKRSLYPKENSINFGTILSALCNSSGKWEAFSETTPKCNEEKNSTWHSIRKISDNFNAILKDSTSREVRLKISEVLNFVKLLYYLPLEYLLPGNQIRCLLGLSALAFAIKTSENAIVIVEILSIMINIFEGVRSIWLFDFIHPAPYLGEIKKITESLLDMPENSENQKILALTKKIMSHLFNLCTRNADSVLAMKDYALELLKSINEKKSSMFAVLILLQRFVELLGRSYLQPKYKEVCQELAIDICSSVYKCVKHMHHQHNVELIYCYTGLLELATTPTSNLTEKKQQKWLKYLPTVIDISFEVIDKPGDSVQLEAYLNFLSVVSVHSQNLTSFIPNDFPVKLWNSLQSYFDKLAADKNKLLYKQFLTNCQSESSSQDCSTMYQLHILHHHLTEQNLQTHAIQENIMTYSDVDCNKIIEITQLCNNSSYADYENVFSFSETEKKFLTNAVKLFSCDELKTIFREIIQEVNSTETHYAIINAAKFQVNLLIFEAATDVALEKKHSREVAYFLEHWLRAVQFTVDKACDIPCTLFTIVVPALRHFTSLLRKLKKNTPKRCILQCLHSCLSVKLEQYIKKPAAFTKAYMSIWNILHELFVTHFTFIVSSTAAFMVVVTMLLKSVIQASREQVLSPYSCDTQQEIEQCAKNLDRLFSLLSKHKEEFSKVVPYLIADYVSMAHSLQLHSSTKIHVVAGINKLLSICSEESIYMLKHNINSSYQNFFQDLVDRCKQHRYEGV